jgi:hypothetical protein
MGRDLEPPDKWAALRGELWVEYIGAPGRLIPQEVAEVTSALFEQLGYYRQVRIQRSDSRLIFREQLGRPVRF